MTNVLLVRSEGVGERDAAAMATYGISVELDAYLEVRPLGAAVNEAAGLLDAIANEADWLVVASKSGVDGLVALLGEEAVRRGLDRGLERGLRVAAVGRTTAARLQDLGAAEVLVGEPQTAAGLLEALRHQLPGTAVYPVGDLASPLLRDSLEALGWRSRSAVVYSTQPVSERPRTAAALAAGAYRVVVLRSPSAVAAVARWVPHWPSRTTFLCGGETTAAAAKAAGIGKLVVSDGPGSKSVAAAVSRLLGLESEER